MRNFVPDVRYGFLPQYIPKQQPVSYYPNRIATVVQWSPHATVDLQLLCEAPELAVPVQDDHDESQLT